MQRPLFLIAALVLVLALSPGAEETLPTLMAELNRSTGTTNEH